eukprot:886147-Ditylum_brightwellii.AAC.1
MTPLSTKGMNCDPVTHPLFDVSHTSSHGTNIHAPAFMPHPRPLMARVGNLNHKGGHAEGDPPKKLVWRRREQSGSATSGFWRGRALA